MTDCRPREWCGRGCSTRDNRRDPVPPAYAGVIRQAHAQGADAETVQQARQAGVPVFSAFHCGSTTSARRRSRAPETTGHARCCCPGTAVERAGEGQVLAVQSVIRGGLVARKKFGIGQGTVGEFSQPGGSIPIGLRRTKGWPDAGGPIGAPFEGANDAVGVAGGKLALPAVDPPGIESWHLAEEISLTVLTGAISRADHRLLWSANTDLKLADDKMRSSAPHKKPRPGSEPERGCGKPRRGNAPKQKASKRTRTHHSTPGATLILLKTRAQISAVFRFPYLGGREFSTMRTK